MESQTKRAGIEQLMDRTERGDSKQQVLFDLGKIRSRVQHHHAGDVAEMERRFLCLVQRFNHVQCNQGWKGPASRSFNLETELVKHLRSWVTFPFERVSQLHQFSMQALETACFGQSPRAHARGVKKRESRSLGGFNAFPVQRHEHAGLIIEEHRQTEINMEKTDEAVER